MKPVLFLLFLFLSFSGVAQIANIESQRIQSDTIGWFGNLGTSFSLIKNVQQITSFDANAHVEYKTAKDLYLFIADYNLLKSGSQDLTNNMFYHLRYNRKLNKWLRWEVFTQLQQNTITGINLRVLAGTGPRFKIVNTKKIKLYAGTAALYEYEQELTSPPIYHNDLRNSTYASVTYLPVPTVQITSTTFYQPLFRQLKDYRLLNQTTASIKISRHFSFVAAYNYLFDAFPAANTPKVNYAISNGLTYSF